MVPSTKGRYSRTHLLPISVLAGVLVVALGTVSLVSIYLNRLSASVDSMAKMTPLESYQGRPEKTAAPGTMAPLDVLVLVADSDQSLLSVQLVNLSGSRQELSLVGLPSDLLVTTGPRRSHRTLADLYRVGPAEVTRQVEQLLQVRIDHQAQLDVDGLATVVDALGGLDHLDLGPVGPRTDPGQFITSAPDGSNRAERVSLLIRGTMERLGWADAMTNPYRFDALLRALEHCIRVDSGLTTDELEATLMESSVRAEEIGQYLLPTSPVKGGRTPDPRGLVALRKALAADAVLTLSR